MCVRGKGSWQAKQGDGRQAGPCERNGEIEADTTDYASRFIAKQGKCVANAEAEREGLGFDT